MRSQVTMRAATEADAAALVTVWADVLRKVDPDQQLDDVRQVVDQARTTPEDRIVVAELDGRVVGAVHLRATSISPINLEPVLQAISPHVLPDYRRHGVGSMLVEAAVAFAEELGIGHVGTAVSSGSRDSNRFMARLSLAPAATLRVAPTASVKNRLSAQRPVVARAGRRQLPHVLAARRSMRRREPTSTG